MVKFFPSLLAANFFDLSGDIRKIEKISDGLHLDVMDGFFVPNISFGFPVIKSVRENTDMFFDTHLMIESPERYIDRFCELSDAVTVHYESTVHLHRAVSMIKEKGCKAGVSLNPSTPVAVLQEILPYLDTVLIMSVNPGFTGQKFIETSVQKVARLAGLCGILDCNVEIMVDGGVNSGNIQKLYDAGATSFVLGAAVFHADDPQTAIQELRKAVE
ncbi:MAG TPA: ribulose-phosphate 3-epimerase [Petrotogaceae bacterium]|jgi:ribulose-phosphate 3-epimerase|nr:ribulose-phosphate 3-epimerase [Petrotogaceae bacterium]HNY37320.1 ribulose-phosphate 3-epimerase [Petrotogaceae bacterium]HPA93375.1 ribulose-phosphate 3-epimerase [Petrotogaceae bacterium]HPO27413.1 ribulose-phosphate 3-epimerase [Petrotogaceae bacterium]HQC40381.1 ribulose-phosphate 3-epimerase [Petrotogaceae bacterium]